MLRLVSDIFPVLILYSGRLNTGDKSLNVRHKYKTNIGKISLSKRNITA